MNKADFLKKQHLDVFEEKRKTHKELVSELYREYISDKDIETEDKGCLFGGFYRYFAKHFPAEIYEKESIVGTNWHWCWQKNVNEAVKPHNRGHFMADFRDFLKKGISGKIDEAETPVGKTTLTAFSEYIKSYAKRAEKDAAMSQGEEKERLLNIARDCSYISENPPVSFRQALQFIWFIQCFLETEAGTAAISFGRADSYLYPYYKNDTQADILTPEEAKELIMCFYIKVSEGNESCMLTVGGDEENELTSLFIEAQTVINMRQPSIALRVSESTSEDVLNKATELVLNGAGMPAYVNDEVIIEGLKMAGIDEKDAADYGIVGCYEAAPMGAFSDTVAYAFNIYDSFNDFIGKRCDYSSFEEFLNAYKSSFEAYYKNTLLPGMKKAADDDRSLACPFADLVLYREKYLLGINILGIGILIDSLYTIKKLVFDEKYTTIENMKLQAEKDFEDNSLYNKILSLDEHYGSNTPESNSLAKEISEFIGNVFRDNQVDDNVISLPALFCFTADIRQRNCDGTVNGRRKGELLSYGIMPCATPHTDSVTNVLMSCANISAVHFPDGCPVMISLGKKDIMKDGVLSALIKSFFKAGGFHIAVNTVDAKLLEEAKKHPGEHSDIMVKISGYSTQFIPLSEEIQNAVIERAIN